MKDNTQNQNNNTGIQIPPPAQPNNQSSDWLKEPQSENKAGNITNSDIGSQPPAGPFGNTAETTNPVQSVPQLNNPADSAGGLVSEAIVGPHDKSGGGGFKIFVIIGILIIVAVWSGVAYLYFNKNKSATNEKEIASKNMPSITPTPVFSPDQIKIKNGSIVYEKFPGETVVLVNKADYSSTGITGFLKVKVSPDNKILCFESWPPAPEPALYISDIDGKNVVEASPNRKNCLWSKDSKSIFYLNTAAKTSPVNIFKYDIFQKTEADLTGSSIPSGVVRQFQIVGLSADGSKIICKYDDIGGSTAAQSTNECEINLESGQVTPL